MEEPDNNDECLDYLAMAITILDETDNRPVRFSEDYPHSKASDILIDLFLVFIFIAFVIYLR